MLRCEARLDFLPPLSAVTVMSALPSMSFARKQPVEARVAALRNRRIGAAPSASPPGPPSSVRSRFTGAFGPEPSILFATVTLTSNVSPGATNVGTLGLITNGPRTCSFVSAEPTASAVFATTMTRIVPAK